MAILRTDTLATLLLQRIIRVGPMTEPAAVLMLESRAPGRGLEIIEYAQGRGMICVLPGQDDQPATITAPAHHPIAA